MQNSYNKYKMLDELLEVSQLFGIFVFVFKLNCHRRMLGIGFTRMRMYFGQLTDIR